MPQQKAAAFSDPWLMRLASDEETVGQLRERVRARLGLKPREFAGWKTVLCT